MINATLTYIQVARVPWLIQKRGKEEEGRREEGGGKVRGMREERGAHGRMTDQLTN